VSLFGCGPSPVPVYAPNNVADAWTNHFDAFGGQDLDKIMLDYDAESVLQIYNDACSPGVMTEFVGNDIRGFFDELFTTLTPTPGLVLPVFTQLVDNPIVESCTLPCDEGLLKSKVFLVWSSVAQGIEKATDTFLWKDAGGVVKVKKQNIVATQPSACTGGQTPVAPNPDPTSPITQGWNNHLAGFGSQNRTMILQDYLESSIVEVFDWSEGPDAEGMRIFTGLDEIGDLFTGLWFIMNAFMVNGSIGLAIPPEFPRVEVDKQSVFLMWSSLAFPKATDTFLFDADGKILRQTIVQTFAGLKTTRVVV